MLYLSKEIKQGMRTSKFIILAAGLMFFALMDPIMTKVLLPMILKSQFPEATADALAGMVNVTQLGSMQTYMGDVFEIGTIIVVFTLCGAMAQEIKDGTLILPVCSGKSFSAVTAAKLVVFGAALVIITVAAMLSDYAYAGMLMGFGEVNVSSALLAGVLQGLYMAFIFSCMLVFGAFLRRPIATGILTLIVAYGAHFVGGALGIARFLPSGLMDANIIAGSADTSLWITALITAAVIAGFYLITVARLKNMELSRR